MIANAFDSYEYWEDFMRHTVNATAFAIAVDRIRASGTEPTEEQIDRALIDAAETGELWRLALPRTRQ